jgi:hypothetical protein
MSELEFTYEAWQEALEAARREYSTTVEPYDLLVASSDSSTEAPERVQDAIGEFLEKTLDAELRHQLSLRDTAEALEYGLILPTPKERAEKAVIDVVSRASTMWTQFFVPFARKRPEAAKAEIRLNKRFIGIRDRLVKVVTARVRRSPRGEWFLLAADRAPLASKPVEAAGPVLSNAAGEDPATVASVDADDSTNRSENAAVCAPQSQRRPRRNPEDRVALERLEVIGKFIAKTRADGIQVNNEKIAKAAKPGRWNDRTPVERWYKNYKSTKDDDRLIRRLLARDPKDIWPGEAQKNRRP